jgi:hypothetical protein
VLFVLCVLQGLQLALSCLSYDFVGTCADDSSEDMTTIQVGAMFGGECVWGGGKGYALGPFLQAVYLIIVRVLATKNFMVVGTAFVDLSWRKQQL